MSLRTLSLYNLGFAHSARVGWEVGSTITSMGVVIRASSRKSCVAKLDSVRFQNGTYAGYLKTTGVTGFPRTNPPVLNFSSDVPLLKVPSGKMLCRASVVSRLSRIRSMTDGPPFLRRGTKMGFEIFASVPITGRVPVNSAVMVRMCPATLNRMMDSIMETWDAM